MARIAIFDSGVGGLSIHAALLERLPQHQYLFVSDNLAHPYGTKDDSFLVPRVESVVQDIVDKHQPDIIVVACNTASTVVLPSLRQAHSTPIVGVVPAIKPAALSSGTKRIAILGTPATMSRPYTQELIDEFASSCTVVKVGSSLLVELAEDKLQGREPDLGLVKQELTPILNFQGCDAVVLACTHFPLLNNEIDSIFKIESQGESIQLIDSGGAIARRVEDLLLQLEVNELDQRHSDASLNSAALMTKDISGQDELIAALDARQLPYLGVL